MNQDPDPAVPAAEPTPHTAADRSRGRRAAALINTTALLATTALLVAIDPKIPPYKGD